LPYRLLLRLRTPLRSLHSVSLSLLLPDLLLCALRGLLCRELLLSLRCELTLTGDLLRLALGCRLLFLLCRELSTPGSLLLLLREPLLLKLLLLGKSLLLALLLLRELGLPSLLRLNLLLFPAPLRRLLPQASRTGVHDLPRLAPDARLLRRRTLCDLLIEQTNLLIDGVQASPVLLLRDLFRVQQVP
jgi:hypothetical protein